MSISKEERERLEQASQEVRQGFAEARESDALIGYYGFMDRDDVEACAEGVPELTHALDEADSEKAELQKENRRVVEGAAREGSDAEAELAPALGYEYDEEYGWVTGDHTSVTLAMEARWKIAELRQENDRLNQTLASIIVSNDPPTQADIDRAHELVERGEIEDG